MVDFVFVDQFYADFKSFIELATGAALAGSIDLGNWQSAVLFCRSKTGCTELAATGNADYRVGGYLGDCCANVINAGILLA